MGHLRAGMATEREIPVLVLDVTEDEADKILATYDPLAGMAEVDGAAWAKLIDGIEFTEAEFGSLLTELRPGHKAGLTDEDAVPEPPPIPITQPGDLWVMGKHRLLCGDCTIAANVGRLLSAVEPGLMVTDPPYGVNYNPQWRNDAAEKGLISYAARRVGKVGNDDRVDWSEAYTLFPGAIAYVWHADRHASEVQRNLEGCGFEIRNQVIWAKTRFAISRGHYHWQHEPCWYAVKAGSAGNWTGDRSQTTLWQIGGNLNDEAKNNHGTQKPVECMRRPILNHTNPGQSLYDPFVGSGTSIIAAETTGRVCYAMDIDPIYCDVAVKRWEDFTGKKACRGA
jgi:DNA modification methylase